MGSLNEQFADKITKIAKEYGERCDYCGTGYAFMSEQFKKEFFKLLDEMDCVIVSNDNFRRFPKNYDPNTDIY